MPETRLHFYCTCGVILNAPDGCATRAGECPACGKIIIVPDGAVAMPSPSPADLIEPEPRPPQEVTERPQDREQVEHITGETVEAAPEAADEDLVVELPREIGGIGGTEEIEGIEGIEEVERGIGEARIEGAPAGGLATRAEEAPDELTDLLSGQAAREVVIQFGEESEPKPEAELEEGLEGRAEEAPEEELEERAEEGFEERSEERLEGELEEGAVSPSRSTQRADRVGRRRASAARLGSKSRAKSRRSRRVDAEGEPGAARRRQSGRVDRYSPDESLEEDEFSANVALVLAIIALVSTALGVTLYMLLQ